MAKLRIIFMGTAELACASLLALAREPHFSVVAVVTQPDRPKGRALKLHPSPVKEVALATALPVLQPARAREEAFIDDLRQLHPDLIVVVAYGQILPQAILDLPRCGCLNVHTSLLPRHRGAAPIQWAILDGDTTTGVTIMKMDAGLDTGPILSQQTTPIHDEDNSQTLHDRLAQIGAALLVQTVRDHEAGKIVPVPQPVEGVTYARKIKKEDGLLDWAQPARVLWNRVRAFTPWPGASTHLPAAAHPALLKVWVAEIAEESGTPGTILRADKSGIVVACGHHSLRILELQPESGRRMTAEEFLPGHHLKPGDRLG
jgi:methionyl-tRNA formyltransferase